MAIHNKKRCSPAAGLLLYVLVGLGAQVDTQTRGPGKSSLKSITFLLLSTCGVLRTSWCSELTDFNRFSWASCKLDPPT